MALSKIEQYLNKRIPWLLLAAGIGLLTPVLNQFNWGTYGNWLLDLAVHWQWQYAVLLVVGVVVLALSRQKMWPFLLLPLTALPLWASVPNLDYCEQGSDSNNRLKLVSFNLHLDNNQMEQVVTWVGQEQPDVLVFQEVTAASHQALEQLQANYPFSKVLAREDAFGMAVYSKLPLSNAQLEATDTAPATLTTSLLFNDKEVVLKGVHPFPPIHAEAHQNRGRLFEAALGGLSEHTPVLVLGDFNASPWAADFRTQSKDARLARASGLSPSFKLWGGLPIDHVIGNQKHWCVHERDVGPDLGSDHRPVWAILSLKAD